MFAAHTTQIFVPTRVVASITPGRSTKKLRILARRSFCLTPSFMRDLRIDTRPVSIPLKNPCKPIKRKAAIKYVILAPPRSLEAAVLVQL